MPNGGPSDPIYWEVMHELKSREPSYLIEFRFSGYAKETIKELKNILTKRFRVTRKKIVPHITLVGPLRIDGEEFVIDTVYNVCKKYELVKFKLDGFDNFENRVIYVKIKPSEELKNLRAELADNLGEYARLSKFDHEKKFTFHSTLVLKDISRKFDKIWDYLQTWKIPEMDQYVLRVTIIKNSRILAEYDLLQRKMLGRKEALDRDIYKKSIKMLQKKRENSEFVFNNVSNKKISLLSDTHFDHGNIIKYCKRPFNSARQMNEKLMENWNANIKENDIIYFLGDMCYGRGRRPIDFWLGKLNGDISYIRGNHDTDYITRASVKEDGYGIQYGDYKFLLKHDPHRPFGYDGWIIHGDKHNNDLKEYPFINQKNKTVNVSADVVDYTPVNLDRIILLIETGRNYDTING
ncbi:MAG: 2'-5' RNA ligase family protein [Nitrosopumilus sp.]|uniref:2'-5' RNA ligase family protein n=1 Tax=Nitrosopumilus sp. TaxID=2024843 RepID=UPI00242A5120|nr:2'-5' RNA ligase family protein [Nitrosopumilus sp.]MCV0367471.1 2'-5' RNA ligase family protein [Nitrosopumilus sp.]